MYVCITEREQTEKLEVALFDDEVVRIYSTNMYQYHVMKTWYKSVLARSSHLSVLEQALQERGFPSP